VSQESPQASSQAWLDGNVDAMAARRIDAPGRRPAWTGGQRLLYLDGYATGLAYLLGSLHAGTGRKPMTWPEMKADVLWIGRVLRFDVEPGRGRYLDAYQRGRAVSAQAEHRKGSR
jgi:hypothetical protein